VRGNVDRWPRGKEREEEEGRHSPKLNYFSTFAKEEKKKRKEKGKIAPLSPVLVRGPGWGGRKEKKGRREEEKKKEGKGEGGEGEGGEKMCRISRIFFYLLVRTRKEGSKDKRRGKREEKGGRKKKKKG